MKIETILEEAFKPYFDGKGEYPKFKDIERDILAELRKVVLSEEEIAVIVARENYRWIYSTKNKDKKYLNKDKIIATSISTAFLKRLEEL